MVHHKMVSRETKGKSGLFWLAHYSLRSIITRFKNETEGSILIMALVLMVTMLVVGGMSVDFMRMESQRVKLQSVSDRAVVAAANLDQGRKPAEVIEEFFKLEGFEGAITSNLNDAKNVNVDRNSREITVASKADIDTFYLRLIGIDTLTAPALSTAVASTTKVEVSLVLDMSLSMGKPMKGDIFQTDGSGDYVRYTEAEVNSLGLGPGFIGQIKTVEGNETRMFFLRQAAKKFVSDLLQPELQGLISVNLVGYSDHVALSDELYAVLNTTPDSISSNGALGSSFNNQGRNRGSGQANNPNGVGGNDIFVNKSRCVYLEDEDFETLTFDAGRLYTQVPHVDVTGNNGAFVRPTCPPESFQGIIALSQDVGELHAAIDAYVPVFNTSTHIGMKWGTALLDPSMRPVFAGMNTIDPVFRGSRPSSYGEGVSKYIVVMTDGLIRPADALKPEFYDEYAERKEASLWTLRTLAANDGDPSTTFDSMTETRPTVATLETQFLTLCNLASQRFDEVFTISLGLNSAAMTKCASRPANAFYSSINPTTGGNSLTGIFDLIANRITALRLTQ